MRSRSTSWYWLGRAFALAAMFFVGLFGPATAVEAQIRKTDRVKEAVKNGDISAANELIRSSLPPQLKQFKPLFDKLEALGREAGIQEGQDRYENVGFGEATTFGLGGTVPLKIYNEDGSTLARGQAKALLDTDRGVMVWEVSMARGEKEWNFSQELSIVDGELEGDGVISEVTKTPGRSPQLRYESGAWRYGAVAEGITAINLVNTATVASADAMTGDMMAGAQNCATASPCAMLGLAIAIVIVIVVLCYMFCWILDYLVMYSPTGLDEFLFKLRNGGMTLCRIAIA